MESIKLNGWKPLAAMTIPGFPPHMQPRGFTKGECRVLIGHEDRNGDGKRLWHLSISCEKRYPTWDEIKDARYTLLPMGLTFAMLLPPMNEYVNVHQNCFHLWELPQ
jgi:hypothetical protein